MDFSSDLGSDHESLSFCDRCDYQPDDVLVVLRMTSDDRPIYCFHTATMWCAICYGRFAHSKDNRWLSEGRVISRRLPEEIIEQAEKISISLPASYKEGFTFEIDDPEACGCGDCFYHLNAYSSIFLEVDHGQADICAVDPGFIPVHESCLKLYKQYLRARLPGPIGSLDALHHLYDDGLHRVYKEYEHMFLRGPTFEPEKFPIWKEIDDLNGHFGPLDSFRLVESDQFQPDAEILDGFVYNATCRNRVFDMDPFFIDSAKLTAFILSHLKPILFPRPKSDKGRPSCVTCCLGERLPQEISDMIADFLSISCVDLPQKRSGIMPASWWKQELLKGKLLPWLYDLDKTMIEKKHGEPPKNWFGARGTWTEWDWEGLVRELSRTRFYKDLTIHSCGVGVQLALKNRRRIFLIMDDLSNVKPGQKRRRMDIDWTDDDCPVREEDDSLGKDDDDE